jgi:hypothetical protein
VVSGFVCHDSSYCKSETFAPLFKKNPEYKHHSRCSPVGSTQGMLYTTSPTLEKGDLKKRVMLPKKLDHCVSCVYQSVGNKGGFLVIHVHPKELLLSGSERVLHHREIKSDWAPQYTFSLIPRQLSEFRTMCQYHQTSPDSFFTRKAICSIATIEGRITLSDNRLILTSGIVHEEFKVKRNKDYRVLLKKHFGININSELTHYLFRCIDRARMSGFQ